MEEDMPDERDLKEMEEEELWDMINNHRYRISQNVKPCTLIPYLRQARVLNELDEDEILNFVKFPNWSLRTSHMLDILSMQGRNGAMALLESLMIHFPKLYTQITGRKPAIEPSGFSSLIKNSELTEYLVRAVTSMQRELQEARAEVDSLAMRGAELRAELAQAQRRAEDQQQLQEEHVRLRSHMAGLQLDLLKLKDEKCDLYVRYTAAIQENSTVNIHCRDLQLQMYELQFQLLKAQTETDFHQKSLKRNNANEMLQLREENSFLRQRLLEAEKFSPAREDILAQDLEEERDGRTKLVELLHHEEKEHERLVQERDQLVEEKDCLALQVKKLSLDCEMYQQKSTVIQDQLDELQEERDQAYLLRDEAQAQIARSLAEKDTLRGQLVELQEKLFTLRAQGSQRVEEQKTQKPRKFSWDSNFSTSIEETLLSPRPRPPLCRMKAIFPQSMRSTDSIESFSSIRSGTAEPPSLESLRRRKLDEICCSNSFKMWDSLPPVSDPDNDFEIIHKVDEEAAPPSLSSLQSNTTRKTAPPFLVRSRPKALRLGTPGYGLTISFQGEELLSQLRVVGGNKTGVFIHEVKEGSPAQNVGLRSGAQIMEMQYDQGRHSLRMVMEDSTLEEALWALGQVRGFFHLSVRYNQDTYEKLLAQLQRGEVTSGDSFYVRVNMGLPRGAGYTLAIRCNDILHVTDTRSADGSWKASHVQPCNLKDLESGTLPNYYRAQRLLIRAIEDMTLQQTSLRRVDPCNGQANQKSVRIVSTGRLGRNPLWVSVEEDTSEEAEGTGNGVTSRGCVTLMPYTLVTPHHPPASRPVLLLPSVCGLLLNNKLGELRGFQLCKPELLSASECAARMQKSEILEDCERGASHCYTLQSVEKVIKQGLHCVLPLGLDCVRRLHRSEIFPIIIFIALSERSIRKLRSKLHKLGVTEEQLLDCYRSEETLLDKLPCLYRTVAPDSWSDTSNLLAVLQAVIQEEQHKIVWVEQDLL
ncbi:caspase recruitment domain-containing protein 14 isoform X2 [Brienomyrus brachyistius]|nr:caspase recruitment domain-containing protein 14 isoform X2 [Brienomyrus brachyistius]XP_048870504.1 caspase recruitment domain-containing protein 14 isoform X2 [Brienomyrus brachyistius]XP_048870505.1 caspase recruitment domain-containing protein 14 isoform X2 [Brienomyrus brachyistius]